MRKSSFGLLLLSCLSCVAPAQQSVPVRSGVPTPALGLTGQALGEGPFEFPTAEGMDIRVVALARGIEHPYAMRFLPDGSLLITTRSGALLRLTTDTLDLVPVEGGPEIAVAGATGESAAAHGYMNLALHPDFERNSFVYLSYTKMLEDNQQTVAVGRGRWNGEALRRFSDIFVGNAGDSGPAPIVFGTDELLYIAASNGDAQDGTGIGGKVLRISDDGDIPEDNPFVDQENFRPEIFTLGHRNSVGLAVHPHSGAIWQLEAGPDGGDEINILRPGANYGWPIVSLGLTSPGYRQGRQSPGHHSFTAPIVYWMPAISPSAMEFYTGDALPQWTGNTFVGGVRFGQISGTGQLTRILFDENMQELRREVLLGELRQSIRDVRQGPDGLLYVLTDETDGAVLRIEPAILNSQAEQ